NALVPRGYAVGFVSVTGTGDSGGCFTQGGPQEALDIAAAIDYYGSQPWSNGNVGIMGVSYDGTTPQETWVEAPPHLKTIVPVAGISDLYKYNFVNGVHIEPQGYAFNTYYWALEGPTAASVADGNPQHSVMAIDTGVLDAPRVQVQDDDGHWRNEATWPPTDVAHHRFRLTADGRLGDVGGTGTVAYNDGLGSPHDAVDVPPSVDLKDTQHE